MNSEIQVEYDDFADLNPPPPPASPEVIERRARYRRRVGALTGMLGLASVLAFLWQGASGRPMSAGAESAIQASPPPVPAAPAIPQASPLSPSPQPARESAPPAPALASDQATSILGVELDKSFDAAALERWRKLRSSIEDGAFEEADATLATLCRHQQAATRETARLLRALLWKREGRGAALRPVLVDLVAHAKTVSIRDQARSALR